MMEPRTEPCLVARDVWKSFRHGRRTIEVLRGVSLEVRPAESVAIVGKSGVGKSTLLHVLGTIDKPDKGAVLVSGKDVTTLGDRELAALRNKEIGFVFQFHHLLPEFTALENVMIPALLGGLGRSRAKEEAENLLKRVGLGDRLDHRPAELSGGEEQRVAICRALVMRPKVVLADEPTGNLDESTSEEIHSLLSGLNEEYGVALVIATHNMRLASLMQRVYRLEGGRLHLLEGAGEGGGDSE